MSSAGNNEDQHLHDYSEVPERDRNNGRSGSSRNRRQIMLAAAAVAGLIFSGSYMWWTRDDWLHADHPIDRTMERFDYDHATILADQILVGNTNENGITPLITPATVSATDASFLKDDDRVIGFRLYRSARA